jgi:hypothetical protein
MTATTGSDAIEGESELYYAGIGPGERRLRESRRHIGLTSVIVTAALGLLASACSSGPTEGALAGKSATQILQMSLRGYHHQKSVHFVTTTVAGKSKTTEIGATSGTSAIESVQTSGSSLLDSLWTGGTAYVRASAAVLEGTLKLSTSVATANAGKWISMKKGDTGYDAIVQSLSAGAAIFNFVPESPKLRVGGLTQFQGRTAVAVEGSGVNQPSPGTIDRLTMFVSTSAPYLPLGATVQVDSTRGRNLERAASVYGKWNQKVDPPVPNNATPLSSLTS